MISEEEELWILEEFIKGDSMAQLGRDYCISNDEVFEVLNRAIGHFSIDYGEDRPDLPIDDVGPLVDRLINGESIADLALSYNSPKARVWEAVQLKSTHVANTLQMLSANAS